MATPGIFVTLIDKGQNAPPTTLKSTLAWLGVSSGGALTVTGPVYQVNAPGTVASAIGFGPLSEGVAGGVRVSQAVQLAVKVNGSVAGTIGSVTHSGSGPAITISGTPYDTFNCKLLITKGGAQGTATFKLALDGATYGPIVDIPLQGQATIIGTVDLTGGGVIASLDTTTLILTSDVGGPTTCTFVAPATIADVLSQLNTAYGANATASVVQGRYLKIVSPTLGTLSTLSIDPLSTADTLLGVSGSATGSASTYVPPNTGMTVTFAAGTYVLDEPYTWATVEPKFSTTDLVTALNALKLSTYTYRDIVVLASPVDGSETRAFATQLATTLSSFRATNPKTFAVGMMNSSIGTPSTITANDTDVRAAMSGQHDDYVCVTHGDIYMQGTSYLGSFRRPLVFALGIRAAAYPISSDPGNHELPVLEEASTIAPDLVTLARDEYTAVVKMDSQGFTTVASDFGAPYFVRGLTRSTSALFQFLAIIRTGVEAARILLRAGSRYINANRPVTPQGTLVEPACVAIENFLRQALLSSLATDISNAVVTVSRTEVIAVTQNLPVTADIQHLAYIYTVDIRAGVVDVLTTTTQTVQQ